jgi:hypothetical protein
MLIEPDKSAWGLLHLPEGCMAVIAMHGSTSSPRTESTQTVRPESFSYAQESLVEGLNQRFLLFTPVIV